MSETSGVRKFGYKFRPSGYQKPYTICGRTRGKETKAEPTIHKHLHTMLTGDALNRNATKGGEHSAMAVEPENPAWVRNARSSLRGVMTLTWRRGVVIVY